MKKNKDSIGTQLFLLSLFWGSLWGVAEATLGHVLHILGIPGLAGFVMFPLGLFFMSQTYRATGRRSAILWTAMVACCIKMTDLFLPTPNPFVVINPAVAILFESLVVVLLFPRKNWTERRIPFPRLWGMAVSWRVIYTLCVFGFSLFYPLRSFLNLGLVYALQFFVLESLANGFLLYLIFRSRFTSFLLFPKFFRRLSMSPFPLFLFLMSVLIQILV